MGVVKNLASFSAGDYWAAGKRVDNLWPCNLSRSKHIKSALFSCRFCSRHRTKKSNSHSSITQSSCSSACGGQRAADIMSSARYTSKLLLLLLLFLPLQKCKARRRLVADMYDINTRRPIKLYVQDLEYRLVLA